MKKSISLILFYIITCMNTVYAHSGRTDANGGHFNRKTGSYHYHHGYSAHQHPNGDCPYEFLWLKILIAIVCAWLIFLLYTFIKERLNRK